MTESRAMFEGRMGAEDAASIDTSLSLDDPLQEVSDDHLRRLIDEAKKFNEALHAETEMFEKFLKKIEPQLLAAAGSHTAAATQQTSSSLDLGSSRATQRKRSKSKSSTSTGSLFKLTAEQKSDIAQREIEELKDEKEQYMLDSEKVLDNYRAGIEECEVRYGEIRKADHDLEKEVVKGGVHPRTGRVIAEKLERFFTEQARQKETQVEKLRLKNSTLKQQYKKLQLQLKQKEEMGEVLHEVDFQQLKIENQQYLDKIEEKNQELLKLKVMAGKTQQLLNSHKRRLGVLQNENKKLQEEINVRSDMVNRLDQERSTVEQERRKAEEVNTKLKDQLSDYRVPDVMEYVNATVELDEVKQKMKIWKRKVDIAQMALKANRKEWRKLHQQASDMPTVQLK